MSTVRSIHDHIRAGTYRADRHSDRLSLPPSDLNEPEWLDLLPGNSPDAVKARTDAAELWSRTAPALTAANGINDSQRETLTMFCIATANYWLVTRQLSRSAPLIPGRTGELVRNPLHTIRTGYFNEVNALRKELGLSPASAAKIVAPQTGEDGDDLLDPIWD